MAASPSLTSLNQSPRPRSFAEWRGRLDREQMAPLVAIAGSRGKTSVLRAVEAMFRAGGFRFASWTNGGVEIDGERQRGEFGPWSRALTRIAAGGLDVALQELDWATLRTIGDKLRSYPIVAITNLCANNESCLLTSQTKIAMQSMSQIMQRLSPGGRLIVNADDFAVSDNQLIADADRYLIGMSQDSPVMRRHLSSGGDAAWLDDSVIVVHERGCTTPIADIDRLDWTRGGEIPFGIYNALLATAIGRCCGLSPRLVTTGLEAHDARPESMPGSFNVFTVGMATVVVDKPMSPWFLRSALRAASGFGSGRQLRIAGPMSDVDTDELIEVGRLLGRNAGILIAHGEWSPVRLALFRQGAAANHVPPLFLQSANERAALQQALAMLKADDVLFVLAEEAPAVVRLIAKRLSERPVTHSRDQGAA